MPGMGRRRAFRRFGLVAVLVAALPVMYVGGYGFLYWMAGRGSISMDDMYAIERRAYGPMRSWRRAMWPGYELVDGFREGCFAVGRDGLLPVREGGAQSGL